MPSLAHNFTPLHNAGPSSPAPSAKKRRSRRRGSSDKKWADKADVMDRQSAGAAADTRTVTIGAATPGHAKNNVLTTAKFTLLNFLYPIPRPRKGSAEEPFQKTLKPVGRSRSSRSSGAWRTCTSCSWAS